MPDIDYYTTGDGRKGIEQGRAAFAFACVEDCISEQDSDDKNYNSYVKKIPAMIKNHGLGQTLGFMFSKKKPEYDLLLKHFGQYLVARRIFQEEDIDSVKLVQAIVKLDAFEYRHVTKEILSLVNWLKRFAEGRLGGD